ncbi:MAG: hypothetical protein LBN39_05080 [Planctomycetaceae bacterium]|nr:hypothetical protein [Planctomycetaceae bacterium]
MPVLDELLFYSALVEKNPLAQFLCTLPYTPPKTALAEPAVSGYNPPNGCYDISFHPFPLWTANGGIT